MTELELLRQEVAHWKGVAEELFDVMRSIEEKSRYWLPVPPEPPVGTRFVNPADETIWFHDIDGWHCPRKQCPNCPTGWDDVHERLASTHRRELT